MEILKPHWGEEEGRLLHPGEGFPVSRTDTSANLTGAWRTVRPLFEEGPAPCSRACPANTRIPEFMALMAEGRPEQALHTLRLINPMPAVCGRVCPHPCEPECNRRELDQRVNIHAVERMLGDYGLNIPPVREDETGTGSRVAVIGSGPAGLSAAYFLARRGVRVDIFEREAEPGGLLRYGIPEYRLPRDILDAEIGNILCLGVNFLGGEEIRVEDLPGLKDRYDHIFFAPGIWGTKPAIWNYGGPGLFDGLKVLRAIHAGHPPEVGHRVALVGGGNTAFDLARVLTRLGRDVVIIYRRKMGEAPAFVDEVRDALEEGVQIMERSLVTRVEEAGQGGLKIRVRKAGLVKEGIVPYGPEKEMEVDSLIACVGQVAEIDGRIGKDVVLGGDFKTGAGTVARAVASGRRGAFAILERLDITVPCSRAEAVSKVDHDRVKTYLFKSSQRLEPVKRAPGERLTDFREVLPGISMEEGVAEGGRCFSCGHCTRCGACWYFCPDACVFSGINGDDRVDFDLDYCKGCGICAVSCPRGCIVMEEG